MAGPHPGDADNYTAPPPSSGGNTVVQPDPFTSWIMPIQSPELQWSGGSFMPNQHNHRGRTHPGIDMYAPEGTTIYSPISGTVLAAGTSDIGGNWVQIQGNDGYVYYFAHMQYPTHLSAGTQVSGGTQIGQVGNSGSASSTSHHLHFTVKTLSGDIVDPTSLLENGMTLDQAAAGGTINSDVTTIPAGGSLYEVDGVQYVVFDLLGIEGVSHSMYWKLDPGAVYSGAQPQKVTSQQWANMAAGMTGAGSTAAFAGVAPGETWADIWERTLYEMGIYGSDALSDPEVLQVVAAFIARPDMSPEELQTRLRETTWGNQQTDRQKAWNDKSDAQKGLETVSTAADLIGVWFTYTGENIQMASFDADGDGTVTVDELKQGNAELASWAEKIASGQSTQPIAINSWIKAVAEEDPDSPWSRTVRDSEIAAGAFDMETEQAAGQILDLYQQYGIEMTWNEAVKLGKQVAMNDLSLAEVEVNVDQMATALYPNKPQGMTTMTWSQPYRQAMQALLEMPDPSLQDDVLTRALSEGQSLGDFRKTLKADSRWMDTKNARDEFNNVLSGLGQQMGF